MISEKPNQNVFIYLFSYLIMPTIRNNTNSKKKKSKKKRTFVSKFPSTKNITEKNKINDLKEYKKRTIYSLIAIETFFVFLFVYLVYSFSENYYKTGAIETGQVFPLAVIFLAIFLLYKLLEKKFNPILEAQRQTTSLTKDAFKRNLKDFKKLTLLLVDFIFIVVIVLAIWAYLDPEVSIINWIEMGIYPPFSTLGNIAIFAFIMLILYYLYKTTKKIRV